MINHRFPVPLIPVTGKVLNGTNGPALFGDLYDLAGSVSIGLYDADTDALATASGNGKVFYIGYSSEHTKDFLDKWMFGMQLPKGAPGWKFKGDDVIKFEYSEPQRVKAEKWVLGYDGTSGCNETIPKFECGKVYGVRIVASGSPVFRRWAKLLEHEIFTDPICCGEDNCTSGCVDDRVDCEGLVKTLSERISNHVELAQIGVKARFLTNSYSAPAMTVNKYTLTTYDSGDNSALGRVQLQVGALGKVTRVSYNNETAQSVYQYFGTAAAASFVPSVAFAVETCDTCPAGYTTVAATEVYRVSRPLAGDEVLVSGANKQTYANLVLTTYVTGTSAVFVSQDGAVANVDIKAPVGSAITALLADSIVLIQVIPVTCTPAAATPIAWVATAGVGYRSTRDLCISLEKQDCAGGDRLAELQAFYLGNPLMVAGSLALVAGDGCRDSYTLTQYADDFSTDGCLSSDTPVFSEFGGYDNAAWEVVKPAVVAFDEDKKCGIEISAVIPEKYFSDCAMELNDYFEEEPIRLEVSWIHDSYTGFSEDCELSFPSAKRTQVGAVANQTGEWLLREYIKAGAYENFSCDYDSPRLREILDSNRRQQIDRKAFYRIYYLQANTYRKAYNFGQHPETFEACIAFKEGDPKAAEFEFAFGSVLSKFDVSLKKR